MATATEDSMEQNTKALISMYDKQRKLKYGDKLIEDTQMHQTNDNIVRVMSYNVLADGPNYALGKWVDYCPYGKDGDRLAFRRWTYRGPRIMAQIQCYKPDIICLQETTENTFTKYFEPELKSLGYNGVHGIRDRVAANKGDVNVMTDSLFYNAHKFQCIEHEILRLDAIAKENKNGKYTKYFGDYALNYPFLSKLKNRMDICIIAYLQFIKTKKPFIAMNSHLFWDGTYAHVKTSQCLIINHELYDIITSKWNLNVKDVPIVFGTDANSNVYRSHFDILHDANTPTLSGVYELMTTANINKHHIDHPYTRCKVIFDENADSKNDDDPSQEQFIVNLRGLPYSAKEREIEQFFKDEKIKNINIISQYGKSSGSATVEFHDEMSFNTALKKHKQYIGSRYIEITPLNTRKPVPREAKSDDNTERFVLKMLGLPYSAREKEISEFFKDEKILEVVVIFMKDGRASGEAVVEFVDKHSLTSAMKKNKEYMGRRYVELITSDGFELDVAAGRVQKRFVRPEIDDWSISIQWKSAYKEASGCEPLLTCKSPDYWGVSDYIFIGEKCKARSYLEMPYHDDTLEADQQQVTQFPNMPNQVDPSDHIAIVCDVEVIE